MALVREFLARILVVFAFVLGSVALGTWWASILTLQTAGTLSSIVNTNLHREITSQLNHIDPHASTIPNLQPTITEALSNPKVTEALATSMPTGSKVLSNELAHLNDGLASILKGKATLIVDVGQHQLAALSADLRSIAKLAIIASGALAAAALIISPLRHLVLRHLALCAGLVGGVALLFTWAVPELIGHFTTGALHHDATNILSGGNVVRTVLIEAFAGGAVVYLATHLFELIGGSKKFATNNSAPLPRGRVA